LRRLTPCTVQIEVLSEDSADVGVAVVIERRPLLLLVPTHVVAWLDSDRRADVKVNGRKQAPPEVVASPNLAADHLTLLRFPSWRRPRVRAVRVPRAPVPLRCGSKVVVAVPDRQTEQRRRGGVVQVDRLEGGASILSNIRIATGESGSALLVGGRLAAVVQGYRGGAEGDADGFAVALPLGGKHLGEINSARRMSRTQAIVRRAAAVGVCVLGIAAVLGGLLSRYAVGSVSLSDDGRAIIAQNALSFSLHGSWSRTLDNPIRVYTVFSSGVDGRIDRVVVGTGCDENRDGRVVMFGEGGRVLWEYAVPDGECIYSTESDSYDGFLVVLLHVADLDRDGTNEVLAVFVHNHFFPCKLAVLSLDGEVVAEYWHPGYIRTITAGPLGPHDEMFVVASASNNRLSTSTYHPQTLFCFAATDISGQGPPYTGEGSAGSELWYYRIPWFWSEPLDPAYEELDVPLRPKCRQINLTDVDGDGDREIRAGLTDGRYYELDENGNVIGTEAGDTYARAFGDSIEDLIVVPLSDR